MSTKEAKEKLDRLRARRGGHRGVSTKLMKEAMELLQTPEAENIERCEIIAAQLKEKVTLLTQIDEEILNLCDVSEIGVEIEESAEISDRISETPKRKIDKQTKAAKNHDNINTNVNDANSNLNSTTEQGNTTNLIESSTSTTNTTGGNEIEENTSHNSVNIVRLPHSKQ